MQLGRVIGTLVATRKVPGLEGVRFLVVQPVSVFSDITFDGVDLLLKSPDCRIKAIDAIR